MQLRHLPRVGDELVEPDAELVKLGLQMFRVGAKERRPRAYQDKLEAAGTSAAGTKRSMLRRW